MNVTDYRGARERVSNEVIRPDAPPLDADSTFPRRAVGVVAPTSDSLLDSVGRAISGMARL
jgi:hypothetical protein